MCEKAVDALPQALEFVPDHYRTQKMCEKAVKVKGWTLVSDPYKTPEVCERAVDGYPWALGFVSDQYKTR